MRIGSLCSGYGGLEMGVQSVMGGTTAWVSDIDKGACKILVHRFPGVPNIGDMTAVEWDAVEPVDLICGGTPCQDLSHAGKRAGMTEGTRSNLWVSMREAIATIRPKYVVWENVRGAASAEADSDLVNQPRLLAGVRRRDGQPVLRALGRVVGDLSDLGYVGQVRGLRAADVGAPHGRFRYFILATDASDGAGHGERSRAEPRQGDPAASDAERGGRDGRARNTRRGAIGRAATQGTGEGALLPTPVADNSRGLPSDTTDYASLANAVCALLPTPTTQDGANTGGLSQHDRNSLPLNTLVTLLPTPTTMDHKASGGNPETTGTHGTTLTDATVRKPQDWGQYAAAIHRWEQVLGVTAPAPTELGPKGNPRLSAAFSEFMMGLPAGWVTDVPGITRNEALRALGNGVVPQQCAAALAEMLAWQVAA